MRRDNASGTVFVQETRANVQKPSSREKIRYIIGTLPEDIGYTNHSMRIVHFSSVSAVILGCLLLVASSQVAQPESCPFHHCLQVEEGLARYDCISAKLFAPLEEGTHPDDAFYVQHDCHRVGWGNSVRGFFVTASLAMMTGRRLSIYHPQFNRMFDKPGGGDWDYGLEESMMGKDSEETQENIWYKFQDQYVHQWDYEAHRDIVKAWPDMLDEEDPRFTSTVLGSGMCGGSLDYIQHMSCLQKLMPKYMDCLTNPTGEYLPNKGVSEANMPAPWFHMSFSRPSSKMVEYLAMMRDRMLLPRLPDGTEPVPGQWGLRTPGTYLFALHYRNIPIGFEPVAIDMRQGFQDAWKQSISDSFWEHAKKSAVKAASIAKCRGEELLIYVATDDPYNLRARAEEELGDIGRVVFGLEEENVGHMFPGWSEEGEEQLRKAIDQQSVKGLASGLHGIPIPEDEDESEEANAGESSLQNDDQDSFTYHKGERSEKARERHGDWAMAEWFALSSAQWLVGHSGSSYAETASGLGFAPLGNMERYDMVHGHNHVHTTFRLDWEGDSCTHVGAADPAHRDSCPNTPDPNPYDSSSDNELAPAEEEEEL